jgi:hypothetical protein
LPWTAGLEDADARPTTAATSATAGAAVTAAAAVAAAADFRKAGGTAEPAIAAVPAEAAVAASAAAAARRGRDGTAIDDDHRADEIDAERAAAAGASISAVVPAGARPAFAAESPVGVVARAGSAVFASPPNTPSAPLPPLPPATPPPVLTVTP